MPLETEFRQRVRGVLEKEIERANSDSYGILAKRAKIKKVPFRDRRFTFYGEPCRECNDPSMREATIKVTYRSRRKNDVIVESVSKRTLLYFCESCELIFDRQGERYKE